MVHVELCGPHQPVWPQDGWHGGMMSPPLCSGAPLPLSPKHHTTPVQHAPSPRQ
jgi:hypothetical protein